MRTFPTFLFSLLIAWTGSSAQKKSNDANLSKLFTIGETGGTCEKGTGYMKFGINMIFPTLNAVYTPFTNWEMDVFWAGFPTLKDEKNSTETGFNVSRLGFKHHVLEKEALFFTDRYNLSWGLKLHGFKFLSKRSDTTVIDKTSWFLIPFVSQSFTRKKLSYHLYFSFPMGGDNTDALGIENDESSPTYVFVSGLEYAASKYVKYILEYWFTNLGGFLDVLQQDGSTGYQGYNQQKEWLSYMFLGTRLSFRKSFYCELGLSSHWTLPPFPFTGLLLNFGWYFR